MSHPTTLTITKFETRGGLEVEVYADGKCLCLKLYDYEYKVLREEALLLVEAITARLAEVTEGQ